MELYKRGRPCHVPREHMQVQRVARLMVWNGLAVALGAVVGASCIGVNYPTVAFRCNPRQQDNCPESHTCCSDDPAAPGGSLPRYEGRPDIPMSATPFFSGENNLRGTSGMCVRTADIPPDTALVERQAEGCPLPCNPSWSAADVGRVCGTGRICCQTVELDARDCVQEDGGPFRPATGRDINRSAVVPNTNWSPASHVTHQDPGGAGCTALAGGNMGIFDDCIANLGVASQRGFCLPANSDCPTSQPTYVSACDLLNGATPAPEEPEPESEPEGFESDG